MSRLHLQNRSPGSDDPHGARAGMKRRADSPPRDMTREQRMSVGSTSEPHEMYHRRSIQHIPSREGPVNRHHSSLSSASSYGPRHGSLGSSLGVVSMTSSATSFASGRASPSGLSPAFDPDLRISTPYHAVPTPNNVTQSNTSPRHRIASESGQGGQPEHASDSAPHSRNGSVANSQGAHACECCPKKPKKFDTIEELRYEVPSLSHMLIANFDSGCMNPRSNTLVRIVRIASKTRTRPSDIKTRSIFAGIAGAAPF